MKWACDLLERHYRARGVLPHRTWSTLKEIWGPDLMAGPVIFVHRILDP